jgi:NADP-dependent 3-hydroxy acid dehydrogenase YdfG
MALGFVAGASEGIGASVARLLGTHRINVVLVARRQAELDAVAATIATETRVVALDLSAEDAHEVLATSTEHLDVGLLVYNAGAARMFVSSTTFARTNLDDTRTAWRRRPRRRLTWMPAPAACARRGPGGRLRRSAPTRSSRPPVRGGTGRR